MKRLAKNLLLLLTSISLSACASSLIPMDSYAPMEQNSEMTTTEYAYDDMAYDEAATIDDQGAMNYGLASEDRKIERYYYYTMDTIDFDTDTTSIDKLVSKYGGFSELSAMSKDKRYNSEEERRTFNTTIKIPIDQSDKFRAELEKIGEIKSTNNYANDLTQNYTDINIRLESRRTELDKLNELVEKAENIEDVMTIQARIIDVQAEIDQIEAAKRDIDQRVAYDTYEIYLSEVYSYNEVANRNPDFATRLGSAFTDSIQIFINFIQDLIIAVVSLWPLILLAVAIVFIIKFFRKRKVTKKITKDDSETKTYE